MSKSKNKSSRGRGERSRSRYLCAPEKSSLSPEQDGSVLIIRSDKTKGRGFKPLPLSYLVAFASSSTTRSKRSDT